MASSEGGEGDKYRSHIHGEAEKNTLWRFGAPPNYDVVNKLFEEGRTKEWASGSLEERVQHMVKTWEMEMFHKTRFQDYRTVNPEIYTFSLNGTTYPEFRSSVPEIRTTSVLVYRGSLKLFPRL